MLVQYMLHLLPCTHQDDIRLCAKYFAIKADQFLLAARFRSFKLFRVTGIGGK